MTTDQTTEQLTTPRPPPRPGSPTASQVRPGHDHHAFADRPGDPHSPYRYGTTAGGRLRGLAHAHLGWTLRNAPTCAARYAPDLLADPAHRSPAMYSADR